MLRALLLLAASAGDMIIVTGQSLSEGMNTGSAITTTQSLGNQMLSSMTFNATTYAMDVSPSGWPWTPLVEFGGLESPRSALANKYTTDTGRSVLLVSGSQGGTAYSGLKKGTAPWSNMAASIEAGSSRGALGCVAAYTTHGESDHDLGVTRSAYAASLVEWQSDIAAKCGSAARAWGQTPLYLDQMSSWTAALLVEAATSPIPMAQYAAAKANPGRVILVGPKYQYSYAGDGVHLVNTASRSMGAKAGQAIAYGPGWAPLWPTSVSRVGAVIIATFNVPSPPLVIDTSLVSNPGNYGFEYTDDSSPPAISSVALCSGVNTPVSGCSSTSQVAITLASTPTGANKKLRYAYTGAFPANAGPTTGPRGNLRDSDPTTWAGSNLYNWCVHFEESVP